MRGRVRVRVRVTVIWTCWTAGWFSTYEPCRGSEMRRGHPGTGREDDAQVRVRVRVMVRARIRIRVGLGFGLLRGKGPEECRH